MSTTPIYGGWSQPKKGQHGLNSGLQNLWHQLAAHPGENNSGLSQRKNEIIELWSLFHRQNPTIIVEIGVAQGGTFASWCQLAHGQAHLIGIDRCLDDCRPRPGDPVHSEIYQGPLRMSSQGGGIFSLRRAAQVIHGINGWSYQTHVLERLLQILGGLKIDFLFHDASHEASMFEKDFEIFWPLIAEGGVFASHDIAPSADPLCNKSEAWAKIKAGTAYSACYEYLPHPSMTEMGIGVLIK